MNIINAEFAEELARELLKINAILLRPNEPFTWASGWNSPIYCDNRKTLVYPKLRTRIAEEFAKHIQKTAPQVEVISGTATAGIPHAAWLAERLELPMAYVRARAKSHGTGNQIEGGVKKGQSTIVVEDLLSTGTSVNTVVEALEFVGANVLQVVSIFTYSFDIADRTFQRRDLPVYSLTDYPTMIKVALEENFIEEKDVALLERWRAEPDTWPKSATS